MKGFTLVEILVSVFILSLLIGGLFLVLNIGNLTYNTDNCILDLQQNARRGMEWMVRDLREGSSLPGAVNIPASPGNTQVTFDTLTETGITYSLDSVNHRITRVCVNPPDGPRILANNIDDLRFTRNADLLRIEVTAVNPQRTDLSFFLREQVRLRNE